MLHPSQRHALEHIAAYARARRDAAREYLEHILQMSNIAADEYRGALEMLRSQARVALHFHPDRLNPEGRSVADLLLTTGTYSSQFETRLSNGSLSAEPGGHRDCWENRLFGGAYNLEGTTAQHRPKYGALNLFGHADGPAPRFGSCYLLLGTEALERCTFSYRDSHLDPPHKGTLSELDDILCALFTEAFENDTALGLRQMRPRRVIELLNKLDLPVSKALEGDPVRSLDHYIEAQVHGPISLAAHASDLVVDPSFRDGQVGESLRAVARRYGLDLHWHGGFALEVESVPSDFRGASMPMVARKVADLCGHQRIDAKSLGRGAIDMGKNPTRWSEFGDARQLLQEIKRLWHVLVRFGHWQTG